ncbi:hypothetical protein Hypma_011344 [Hypsizygus marmoreus]|uniref:Uncharacterized protein n=1 Tax=Hypsizygus marmoreus TaxID=39966 RepID=A0A369JIR9_HYPMA|nr:hypothetical protein Hypma_011344 [Hypsizygus marmoreus]
MRFFRSFKLLHRRTKSDPLIGNIAGANATGHPRTASGGFNDISTILLTALPDYQPHGTCPASHLNIRIFDLETENANLRHTCSVSMNELTQVRSQLKASRAELFAELHRGVRRAKEDRNEIRRLRETLAHYESFLEAVITTSPADFVPSNGRPINQEHEVAVDREGTVRNETIWASIVPSAFGSRTQDEYMSALHMTLKSRMELRKCKKVAKFWKNTAKKDEQNTDVVTPSNSNISSIREILPVGRQKAVDALIAKRRKEALDQPWTASTYAPETPVHPPRTTIELAPISDIPIGSKTLSTSLSFSTESHGLPYKACLSPLASQSLKQELSKMSSSHRLPKWSSGRRVLGHVDLNIGKDAFPLPSSTASQAKHVKPITVSRRKAKEGLSLHREERKNDAKASKTASPEKLIVESENVHSNNHHDGPVRTHEYAHSASSTEDSDIILPSCALDLSNIMEESELPYATLSADDTFEGWVTCGVPGELDVSFGSTADTLFSTAPATTTTTPHKNDIKADSPKSRLPLPVFQTLRRLSLTKVSTTRGKGIGPISKVVTKPSPTRLPVRFNASHAVK